MASKSRRANWTLEEIGLLVNLCVSNHGVLVGKFGDGISHKSKELLWTDVCEKLTCISGTARSQEEVQKKWRDLKSQTKKKEQIRQREMKKTGGGEEVAPLKEWEEQIVCILPKELIQGIEGGYETMVNLNKSIDEYVETSIGDNVIVHSPSIGVEVFDAKGENISDLKLQKKRTSTELIQVQYNYFVAEKEMAETKNKYYQQRLRTESVKEQYYLKSIAALDKIQMMKDES